MRKKTHDDYELELFEKEIDYFPLEQYNGTHTPINHECLKGHIWKAMPKHILKGSGCPYCARNRQKTDEEYKLSIKDKPFSCLESYVNDRTPLEHKCNDCNMVWKTAPSYILQDTGCPYCNTGSFKPDKPGIVYHVSLIYEDTVYYKVGITNNSVKERFKADWKRLNMCLIWELKFDVGKDAKILETQLLASNKRVVGIQPLRGKGNTELLYEEIPCPIK